MDPDSLGPVLAGAATLLALLGARRQHATPEGTRTPGQRVAAAGTATASATADLMRRGGDATANGTVLVSRTAIAAANNLAAGTARVTAHLANRAAALIIGVAGQATAQTSGLLLDGVASLVGELTSPTRRAPNRARSTPLAPE